MGAGSSVQAQATEDCSAVKRLQVVVTMVMAVVGVIVMAVVVVSLYNGGCNEQEC